MLPKAVTSPQRKRGTNIMTKKEISKVAMYSIAMLQDMYVARGDSYEEAFANALEDVDISESEYKEIQKCFVGKRGTIDD